MSLPSGYKRLEYIQSTGTQYIDTGIKGKSGIVVKTTIIPTAIGSDVCVIGSIYNNGTRYNCGISAAGKFELQYGTQYGASSVSAVANTEYELEIQWVYNDGFLKVNGATAQTRTGASGGANHNMFLGARNNGGTADRKASLKIKSTKIYDNGALARDFIPCKNASNVVGLWDNVNGVFYANAGTGTFTAGAEIGIGVDEWTELEWIASSGAQYINTGFIPQSQNIKIDIDFAYTANHAGKSIYGTQRNTSPLRFAITAYDLPQFYVGTSQNLLPTSLSVNTRYKLQTETKNGVFSVTVNGTKNQSSYNGTLENTLTLSLFGNNSDGNTIQLCSASVYAFSIYDNDTLVRDFIPAKSNGIVGMYDTVDGILYTNCGSGAFTAGPEVPTAPPTPTDFSGLYDGTDIALTWTASTGADGYKVYRNGIKIADITATSYTDTAEPFTATVYGVSAYNTDGESEQAQTTVSAFPSDPIPYLITDRTNADVVRLKQLLAIGWDNMTAEEKAEFSASLKGAYNATDLNRVGAAVQFIADHLAQFDYNVSVSPKTDWTITDIPTVAQMQAYLADVEAIRTALTAVQPLTPTTMDNLTYISANAIEQILLAVDTLIFGMISAFRHSGTTYSNMGGLLL